MKNRPKASQTLNYGSILFKFILEQNHKLLIYDGRHLDTDEWLLWRFIDLIMSVFAAVC